MDALQEVSELGGRVRIDGRGYRPGAWRIPPSPHAIPSPVSVAAVGLGVRAGMSDEQVATRGARLGRWDALILLYAVLAALCRPLTAPAAVVVLLPGAALLALAAWQRAPPRRAVCLRRCVVPWVVLALLFGGWELTATLWGNDSAHPTFSLLLDPVLETYPGRLRLARMAGRRPVAGDPVTAHLVILVGFAGLLGAMLAMEVLGRAGREPFRPVAHVLEATLASRTGRWVVWGAWLWIGFHFLAR